MEVKEKKNTFIFDTDEFPRPSTSMEVLSKLKPIVKADGTVTQGGQTDLAAGALQVVEQGDHEGRWWTAPGPGPPTT